MHCTGQRYVTHHHRLSYYSEQQPELKLLLFSEDDTLRNHDRNLRSLINLAIDSGAIPLGDKYKDIGTEGNEDNRTERTL